MRKQMLVFAVLTCVFAFALPAAAQNQYQLKQKYTIGGDGGWDYLTYDPAGKRLFISRFTRVQVVDPAKGTLITEIPGTTGVHGIALAQELGKGFTSNGGENTVTVFDLKTLKETSKIKLPDDAKNPDAILYDAATKRVFTFNGRSKNATVIDAEKGTVVSNIPLDGKPEFAAADGKGMVYVNIEDKGELTSIDAKKAAVVATWPLAGCEEPSGLAMDQKGRVLFSGCGNKVMAVTNADNGKQITTVPSARAWMPTALIRKQDWRSVPTAMGPSLWSRRMLPASSPCCRTRPRSAALAPWRSTPTTTMSIW
jgi:DNA-binding beta-propeller fold protein YncE